MVKSSAPLQRGRALYRVLWGVVFALALALAGGTLYAYFRGSAAGDGRGSGRRKIPWDAILIEEREKTGTRSLKSFIFPWKD